MVQIVADNAQQPNIARLFTILSAEATSEDHPAHEFFRARYERVAGEVHDMLKGAMDHGEISTDVNLEQAARVVLATMAGLQLQWLLDPTVNMPDLFRDQINRYLGWTAA
jgi:BetI-type transcriptional repressor, C-terminal